MKNFLVIVVAFFITGCAGESTTGALYYNQYTPVQDMGNNQYMIQGHDTEAAITGARAHCSKANGSFALVEMQPHTQTERATLLFKCQ